jgi:hypothetical protein
MLGSVRAHAYVGVLLCDAGYESTDEIMGDIEVARKLARAEKHYLQYDRETLMMLRSTVQDAS